MPFEAARRPRLHLYLGFESQQPIPIRESWLLEIIVQFRDLELGDIQLEADACPQAP
jgi:hypothetical protein